MACCLHTTACELWDMVSSETQHEETGNRKDTGVGQCMTYSNDSREPPLIRCEPTGIQTSSWSTCKGTDSS